MKKALEIPSLNRYYPLFKQMAGMVFWTISLALAGSSCARQPVQKTNNHFLHMKETENPPGQFLAGLLKEGTPIMNQALDSAEAWNLQIIYTRIDRQKEGAPVFSTYTFPGGGIHRPYFYPASAIKLPVAILAMEKLAALPNGIGLQTAFLSANVPDTASDTPAIPYSLETDFRNLFILSDNDAFNRMYAFLGQEAIYKRLQELGFQSAEIRHRLAIALSPEANRITGPLQFFDEAQHIVYSEPLQKSAVVFKQEPRSLGRGFMSGGTYHPVPMDFTEKNKMNLDELHESLVRLVFPEAFPEKRRYRIPENDRKFLLKTMSTFPGESVNPVYDSIAYYNTFNKFIYWGAEKQVPKPGLRIFNKTGMAYGHLLDIAYVVDTEQGIEFFCSAVLYVNPDGVLNDDQYGYETEGLPFLRDLGRALYQYELKRERKIKPDFSSLRFSYGN